MRYADLFEAKLDDYEVVGATVGIWFDMSARDLRRCVNSFGVIRGLIDGSTGQDCGWCAIDASHNDVRDVLDWPASMAYVAAPSLETLLAENDWSPRCPVFVSHGVFFLLQFPEQSRDLPTFKRLFPDWSCIGHNDPRYTDSR